MSRKHPVNRLIAGLAAAAVALPLSTVGVAEAAEAAGPPRATACGQVELAPILKQDFAADGKRIEPKPDQRGVYIPIIMVPDWTGQATHDEKRTGDFSGFVDMNAAGPPPEFATASLIGRLQAIPGAAVYTFDYRGSAGRWVDDPGIGPALGDAIDCLTAALGQKAILVTKGLGGVAARYAVAGQVAGGDRANKVTTVIGFGSPQQGTQLGDLTNTGVGRTAPEPRSLLRLLLGACNALAPAKFDPYAPCGYLTAQSRALAEGGSAIAYRSDSPQMKTLLPYPSGVDIDAFAGDVQIQAKQLGWFGLKPFRNDSVSLGDLVSSTASVTAGSRNQLRSTCSFVLDAYGNGKQSVGLNLIDAGTPQLGPDWGATVRPCFVPNLTRVADFAASTVQIVTKEIRERRPLELEELETLSVPSMCGHPAGKLVGGRLPGIAPGAGEVVLAAINHPERAKQLAVFGDLTSDGVRDTVVVVNCSDAQGQGPDSVLVYDSQANLLGGIGLDRVTNRRDNDVYRVVISKQKARVEWRTTREGDAVCCPTVDAAAVFSYDTNKRALQPDKLVSYTEVGPASQVFEAVRRGKTSAAVRAIASDDIFAAMLATHRNVGAFLSFSCYGSLPGDSGWPRKAREDFGQSWPPDDGLRHGDRYCLIRLADKGSTAPTPSPTPGATAAPTAAPTQERYVLLGLEHVGFNKWQVVEYRTPGEVPEEPDDGGIFEPPTPEPTRGPLFPF
jgi:hypothetical protein